MSGELRRLQNEELHISYVPPPNTIKNIEIMRVKMGTSCISDGGAEDEDSIVVENPEGKRPLGIPKRCWEGNRRDLPEAESIGE